MLEKGQAPDVQPIQSRSHAANPGHSPTRPKPQGFESSAFAKLMSKVIATRNKKLLGAKGAIWK